MLSVGSLFSGIGGIDLGLESTGHFRTIWNSEINPYGCRVLKTHWPNVPNLGDVRTIKAPPRADVVAGGFPCQDLSYAGKGRGLRGARSGLFYEMLRIVDETRPRWVVAENVPGLITRGLGEVLGAISGLGYDSWWDTLPAAYVGAPHLRYRVVLVSCSDPHAFGRFLDQVEKERRRLGDKPFGQPQDVGSSLPHTEGLGRQDGLAADLRATARGLHAPSHGPGLPGRGTPWDVEPDVGRMADGLPEWVDELEALGNAVVPELFARAGSWIAAAEGLT